MMSQRKLPNEIQVIFDKYIDNNVRRLKRETAVKMFVNEFHMTETQAEQIFDSFDKDKNGVMSIWEFEQYYQCVGEGASAMIKSFTNMDKDNSGKLDIQEARAGLKAIDFGARQLTDREIEFFLNNSKDSEELIDLGQFANLLFRLKVYRRKSEAKLKTK